MASETSRMHAPFTTATSVRKPIGNPTAADFANIQFTTLVGHVPHGTHANALEQSEASSKCTRETNVHRPRTIARYNLAYSNLVDSSQFRQNFVRNARRPCPTWHPRRCFETKRGVIKMLSREQRSPTKNHRQVQPGLQNPATGTRPTRRPGPDT